MKNENKNFETRRVNPFDIERFSKHIKIFPEIGEEERREIIDYYENNQRINPVIVIERIVDGFPKLLVINGWKFIFYARDKNLKGIEVRLLRIEDDDIVVELMCELQCSSNTNSPSKLYKMIEALWKIYFKGKGFRSDVHNAEGEESNSIYKKIQLTLKLNSENQVKHIRKIGIVNPHHFERIEMGRASLFGCYMECLNEEKGYEPNAPKVKAPTFYSTTTSVPEFGETSSTEEVSNGTGTPENNLEEDQGDNNNETKSEEAKESSIEGETSENSSNSAEGVSASLINNSASPISPQPTSEHITVIGICECCGKETKIQINKSQLNG